ncbi:MAG: CHAT domain-containing protein [Desulfobacteraceae bacterium]|nr:CHAT domain-containing protein [Desulfobacteraceae bacterium]
MNPAEPKRILILSANPWDTERLKLDKEYRIIDEAHRNCLRPACFEIRLSPAARKEDFQREMLSYNPHIVHFAGHGKQDSLAFSDNRDKSHWIEQDALARLFELSASDVECVLLNACYTEQLAEAIGQHIDYVVGMEKAIGDIAAIEFSRGFYTALFAGKFYPSAFNHGCVSVQMLNIPEHQTPKLKIKPRARRHNYIPGFGTDICIAFSTGMENWVRPLAENLDNLIAHRLENRNIYTLTLAPESGPESFDVCVKAAALLVVLSRDFLLSGLWQKNLAEFLNAVKDRTRVFILETDDSPRPGNLQSALGYRFWQPGQGNEICLFAQGNSRYNSRLDILADELSEKLENMKQVAEYHQNLALKKENQAKKLGRELPQSILFVNASPEDYDLLKQIISFLDENGAQYTLPLDPLSNRSVTEIRRDLENNFITCDLFLVVYGRVPDIWVREQLLHCHRMRRKRERPLQVMIVHDEILPESKPEINMKLGNLRIYKCPPGDFAEYLPVCMEDACYE